MPLKPENDQSARRLRFTTDCRYTAMLLLWLLAVRLVQMVHSGIYPHPLIVLLADIAAVLVLASCLPLLRPRLLRLAALLLIAFGYHAGGEHMTTHGTLFRIEHLVHALNAVFIGSSVGHEDLIWLVLYLLLVLPLLPLVERWHAAPRAGWRPRALLAGAVLGTYALVAPSLSLPGNNVVVGSIAQIPGALLPPHQVSQEGEAAAGDLPEETDFFQRQDAFIARAEPPNVLMIMIEGFSAAYLPGMAERYGVQPVVELPELERFLDDTGFVVYRNMLTLQRQTNHGTYALLCGDYPTPVTARSKMTRIAEEPDRETGSEGRKPERRQIDCVPKLLAEQGYRTAYIQAAPLSYMHKDKFMARAGFGIIEGRDEIGEEDVGEGWGPTDDRFMAHARERIEELDTGDRPWFATLLNVGTHHPFLPQGAEDPGKGDPTPRVSPKARHEIRQRAFRRMSEALRKLLERLEANGVLSRTAVFITSDESGGLLRRGEPTGLLDHNLGMLAVRMPEPEEGPVETLRDPDSLVAQIDIPVTVLDLAGLPGRGNLIGRGLIMGEEPIERGLVFGDTYSGRTFFLRESGRLLSCGEGLVRCQAWSFDPRLPVASLEPSGDAPFLTFAQRRELVHRAGDLRPE